MANAHEATEGEAEQRIGAHEQGITLGRHYFSKDDREGRKLIYTDDRHALIFGPTGAGKTTRLLMVNLLSDCLNDRSVIVVDPKGELAAVCAKHRAEIGHDVKILDPFGKLRDAVGRSAAHKYLLEHGLFDSVGFNPLADLDPGTVKRPNPNFFDDAAAVGEALIKIQGNDPHWTESAQGLITGLVMWEVVRAKIQREVPSLYNVRMILTEANKWENKENGEQIKGLAARAAEIVEACTKVDEYGDLVVPDGDVIASLVGRFTLETEELASIRSTADTQTRWLLSTRMRTDLKTHGVQFAKLKEKRTSVFVILPAERMRTHSVWLRLVIVSALRALYRRGGLRTLFLIDEMAALGKLGPLEDAFGLVRGYRVQIVGYLQDMAQLQELYEKRWESFLANAGVIQSFAPNDLTTADWLSKRSGQTTVDVKGSSGTKSESASGLASGTGETWSQSQRAVWMPHELIGFKQGTGVIFLAGLAPGVRFVAPAYYRIDLCDRRSLPNPYRED